MIFHLFMQMVPQLCSWAGSSYQKTKTDVPQQGCWAYSQWQSKTIQTHISSRLRGVIWGSLGNLQGCPQAHWMEILGQTQESLERLYLMIGLEATGVAPGGEGVAGLTCPVCCHHNHYQEEE